MSIVTVLRKRDGMSQSEAHQVVERLRDSVQAIVSTTQDVLLAHELVGELLEYEVGLERDYMFELI